MKNSFVLCILLLTLAALQGCEKDVDFDLDDSSPKLVIEATIENDQPPIVILTRSLNYFSRIDPQLLAQSFMRNADVFVSNGTLTHKLKEYSLTTGPGYVIHYYSIDSSNLATAFTGKLNSSYSMRVVAEGSEYTATTTIPNITRRIDSLWWKPAPAVEDSNKALVMVRATDRAGFGDYIRYMTSRNGGPFYPPFNSVFDDLFIDGTTYEIQIEQGIDRNAEREEGENLFTRGDTIRFKTSNIDKATYDFWRTMEFSYASIGNPFSSPVKVLSNINGNALGYFGGYASQYHTLIIR